MFQFKDRLRDVLKYLSSEKGCHKNLPKKTKIMVN
jgi:hypothetical protein